MEQVSPAKAGRNAALSKGWALSKSLLKQQGALIVLVLLFIFASLRYNYFMTPYDINTFLSYNTIFVLLAVDETFVIMTGGAGIDISLGAANAYMERMSFSRGRSDQGRGVTASGTDRGRVSGRFFLSNDE